MLKGAATIGKAKGKRQVSQKEANCRRSSSYPGTGSGKPCFSDGLIKAANTVRQHKDSAEQYSRQNGGSPITHMLSINAVIAAAAAYAPMAAWSDMRRLL